MPGRQVPEGECLEGCPGTHAEPGNLLPFPIAPFGDREPEELLEAGLALPDRELGADGMTPVDVGSERRPGRHGLRASPGFPRLTSLVA